jgi:hypothetical protein
MTVKLEIPENDLRELDKKLAGLSGVAQSKVLLDGMRAAGRAVRTRAKELAPIAQTPGYERGAKASVRTTAAFKIKAFVRRDEPILEVRVKAAKRAPHFHLVELGHRIVTGGTVERTGGTKKAATSKRTGEQGKGKVKGDVKGRPFLSRGGKYSQAKQIAAMQAAARKAISKLTGG